MSSFLALILQDPTEAEDCHARMSFLNVIPDIYNV